MRFLGVICSPQNLVNEVEPLKCLPAWFHGIIVGNDQSEVGGVDACEEHYGYASGRPSSGVIDLKTIVRKPPQTCGEEPELLGVGTFL